MKKRIIIITLLGFFWGVQARDQLKNPLYQQSLRDLWGKIYPDKGETLYCQKAFDNKKYSARENNLNAEHVFPMSWVARYLGCGSRKQCQKNSAAFRKIEADLHNIYPANKAINQARSNYRYGEVLGEKRLFGTCDFEVNRKKRVIEPREAIRGEIARAMLYVEYRYHVPLFKKNKQLMKNWDQRYPPTSEEKRREAIIYRLQKTTNPFISEYPFKAD